MMSDEPKETGIAAFRRLYVARFVERGLTVEDGAAAYNAGGWQELDDATPEEAADEELSYWADDGDIWDAIVYDR